MSTNEFVDLKIYFDGDTYHILSTGTVQDSMVFCHLASTTRGRQQKNGWYPLQMCEWISIADLERCKKLHARAQIDELAKQAIDEYYKDRASSGNSALTSMVATR